MSSSMTPNDRETLSALFDGELEGDAARFAMRRLEHDSGWRDACSRWQLAGDVLRGQAAGVAPSGFAERVRAGLAAEALQAGAAMMASEAGPSSSVPATTLSDSRRWWGRAALAASVAVAALFVTHPFSGAGSGDRAPAVNAPLAAIPAPASPPAPLAAPGTAPAAPAGGVELAAAAVAVADVPRRVGERRARVGAAASSAARRDGQAPVTVALAAADPAPRPAEPVADPFKPPTGDLVARPWPRALLPGGGATGALTASYGSGPAQGSPSFYPFEPNAPQPPATSAEATPQP